MKRVIAFGLVCFSLTSLQLGMDTGGWAGDYTFTKIADNSGSFGGFDPLLSINADGVVAFNGRASTTGLALGIFTGNGGALTTIAPMGGGSPFNINIGIFGVPSINASGTVAFRGGGITTPAGSGANGILTGSGGPLTLVIDNFSSQF